MVFQQDRTGRIMFKLFDKHPSHFPGTLRTQVKLLLHFPINILRIGWCHFIVYGKMSFAKCKDVIVFIIILSFSDLQLAFYTTIRLGELHKARLCCPINLCFNVFCCLGASKRTSVNRYAHFELVEFYLLITCILYFFAVRRKLPPTCWFFNS